MADFSGQWMGENQGTNFGDLIIELERYGQWYEGIAYLIERNLDQPGTIADLSFPAAPKTSALADHFQIELHPRPFDKRTGQEYVEQKAAQMFESEGFPRSAEATLSFRDDELLVKWGSSIESDGEAFLQRSRADHNSVLESDRVYSWQEFRQDIVDLEHYRFIYRGQQNSKWRLRTSFHRCGRFNLNKYTRESLPTVHQHIIPHTNQIFDRGRPEENGAFLSLAQHHGFPTPLLDWSYSPFVAAFFAFRGMSDAITADGEAVRIFVFDRKAWVNDFVQNQHLFTPHRHFSVLETLPIENPRMIPQQALSTVTNLDDIEPYIQLWEERKGKNYLRVIDIPHSLRDEVLDDLVKMGITAGSIFAGLDGVCEQMKDRFFPSV